MSGVDYDARGTGLVRVAHDAGAYYFRVANRAVVGELIRAIEAGGGDIRATPTFREREAVPASPGGAARARGGGGEAEAWDFCFFLVCRAFGALCTEHLA